MTNTWSNRWSQELFLIPLLFTLSGMCFILMVLAPTLPPPYYLTYNALWGSAGAILFAFGIYLTYRLRTFIQALNNHEKPDYRDLNRTFLILFLVLLLQLIVADIGIIFFIIGSPPPPPPPY